jgi:hypothetical protein
MLLSDHNKMIYGLFERRSAWLSAASYDTCAVIQLTSLNKSLNLTTRKAVSNDSKDAKQRFRLYSNNSATILSY